MIVLGKVVAVFLMVLIGFAAGKLGWLPISASKYFSKLVINIAAPCVVIYSMGQQQLDNDTLLIMLQIFGIAIAVYSISGLLSMLIVKLMKVDKSDKGIYKNFLTFTNNAFMGFPVAYALFGSQGMFLMVLANVIMPLFLYTLGVSNLKELQKDNSGKLAVLKQRVKEIFTPPVVSVLIGLVIFIFGIPIPSVINDVLDTVGATMAPLCMIVIGIQLTESSPRRVMMNHKLTIMSLLRLIILPALAFLPMFLLKLDPLVICIMTLNVMMPCSAACVALAEEYGRNAKLAAEGTFLSTLFSMGTIPVIGLLLTTFIL